MSLNRTPGTMVAAALVSAVLLGVAGCAALKETGTVWPVKEYEKAIAGRLDADYVGDETCVAKCHTHDKINNEFHLSIHGEQIAEDTGLPLVNCESCHGPGSLAIANVKSEKDACDKSTFIQLKEIPPGASSLICLKCHNNKSLSNLADWPGSRHAAGNVSCADCHKIHKGPGQKVQRGEIAEVCLSCHQEKRMLFSLTSHHPVLEGKMTCYDCHAAHGTANDHDLRLPVRSLCTRCHAERSGPFVFEHANLTLDCSNCHNPHGSATTYLNKYAQPFLCLQCHNGHNRGTHLGLKNQEQKAIFFTSCTTCHSTLHGTDLRGFGNDDRFTR